MHPRRYLAIIVLMSFFVLCNGSSHSADFHVSIDGNDSAAGSALAPWRTIQHAADSATPGSTIFIHGGTYRERIQISVSGNASEGSITFRAQPGDQVIMDGSGMTLKKDWQPMIWIHDQSYVRIEGLILKNLRSSEKNVVPIGIMVSGGSHHIDLLGNVICDLGTSFPGKNGGDAHGIAVYGENADPIHDLLIAENEIFNLRLGSSEALVLNGNVTDFEVRDNVVRDCNNIGIDFIGYEGVGKHGVDRARNGACRNNLVFNIDSSLNPAYGGDFQRGGGDSSADGIYVDGGANILIEGNVVSRCNIGVEIASEHAGKTTEGITLRNNLIFHSQIGGLFLGGYDTKRGATKDCLIIGNTLFENDTRQDGTGEICLQFDVRNCVFKNNILRTNSQNLILSNPYTQNVGNLLNFQTLFAPSGAAEWQWKKIYYTDLPAYRSASGNDVNSQMADPLFADVTQYDFRLSSTSPARNSGDPSTGSEAGDTDLNGIPRIDGGWIDCGAFEFRDAALGAKLAVEPPTETFGNIAFSPAASVERSFTVTNSGSESYRLIRIAIEGKDASSFRLLRCFSILRPGESHPLRVAASPQKAGALSAELVLYGPLHGGNSMRIPLNATGIRPDHRPDEAVKTPGTAWRGKGIYDRRSGQTATLRLARKKGQAWFRTANAGARADRIRLSGLKGTRLLTVQYFRYRGGRYVNASAAVRLGRQILPLASGVAENGQCRIAKARQAKSRRFQVTLHLMATSTRDPIRRDLAAVRVLASK